MSRCNSLLDLCCGKINECFANDDSRVVDDNCRTPDLMRRSGTLVCQKLASSESGWCVPILTSFLMVSATSATRFGSETSH